jgi:hypothetical protein
VLRRFADARGITFPLVSDPKSAIIRSYGLFNETNKPGTRAYGVPYPGTFIVDRRGRVRARYFEEAYQERNTVASILVRQGMSPFGPASTLDTQHLTVVAAISDETTAPGKRHTLVFDVTPKPRMHVYAPGKHSYQVIGVSLDPQPWLRAGPTRYPPSEIFHFAPLNENVEVYIKPFRLERDVTVLATPEARKELANRTSLTIAGRLEYQACDDKLCYAPQSLPVQWKLELKQLER